jgi:hypothetical protein
LDPWEQQLQTAAGGPTITISGPGVLTDGGGEAAEGVRERGLVEFPDETDIDPYDPTTFGFVEVGVVLGAHGVHGELKVRGQHGSAAVAAAAAALQS